MRSLYLCNVGNRDVWLDERPVPAEEARALGETIVANDAQFQGRIHAPIIEAGLRYILQRGTPQDPMRLSVCLFATNQGEAAGEHRRKDTIHFADVLKRYLPERFPKTDTGAIEDVWTAQIAQNPSYHDAMHEFFGGQLAGRRFHPAQFDAIFVSPVGGVPAANFALLLRAVERYAEKCHPIYVPEGSPHAVPMDIGERLQRGLLRALALQEARNREFGRVAALLRQMGAPGHLVGLADHAERRLHFDFRRAVQVLEDEVAVHPIARDAALRLRSGLDGLLAKQLEALIGELYHNTRLVYANGHYVDFLLRAFRLQEAVLRLIVERELRLPADAVEGRADPELVRRIEDDPELLDHVRRPNRGQLLDYKRSPTSALLRHLLDYVLRADRDGARARCEPLAAILDRLEPLATLRNKSIGAHGFEGVSEEEIRRRYGSPHDVLGDLAELVRLLGVDPNADPFEEVRRLLESGLAREG